MSQASAKMVGMSVDPRRRLGRGVIVNAGDPVPEGWDGTDRVTVDESVLAAPRDVVARLHGAWARREPVVVDLGVDVRRCAHPETDDRPPHELTPAFEFARERLYFLARANNYDNARTVAWRGDRASKAARLGATEGRSADVLLPDGTPAWLDGGPRAARCRCRGAIVHRVRVRAR